MAVMVVSVFLNVLLDPFLIFGFSANPLFGWLAAVPLVAALDPVGLSGGPVRGHRVHRIRN